MARNLPEIRESTMAKRPFRSKSPASSPAKSVRAVKVRKRTIRRSSTVSQFGVGAIYDFGDESLVAMDIFHWNNQGDKIRLPRLEKELGVSHFLMAPVVREQHNPYTKKVPYFRFPQWLFCPSCRRMIRWSYKKEVPGEQPKCEHCPKRSKLVPMRFVTVCKGGHLSDVPWQRWAHSKAVDPKQKQCQDGVLHFESRRTGGGGLGSLWVVCKTCGSARSLQGIAGKDSLLGVAGRCENRQPWEWVDSSSRGACEHTPQVLQRGATNLYFSKVASALDIPESAPEDTHLLAENIRQDAFYKFLKAAYTSTTTPDKDPSVIQAAKMIADKMKCSPEEVIATVKAELTPLPTAQPKGLDGLLREEWDALINATASDDPKASFVAEKADFSAVLDGIPAHHPYVALASCIDLVVLARRLREVRALQGFERQEPGSTLVNPGLDRRFDWLPGIEVYGEGIFISLKEKRLTSWEAEHKSAIEARLGAMKKQRKRTSLSFLPNFSPRFVVLHTLAHMLIRQLSFECGYASSSLRERIFAAMPDGQNSAMAGILIYTAEGDSEGSLGGLVREGQPERLFPTLLTAIQNARWCSADPICRELPAQGLQGLNRAACHACSLVSETSCICSNVMLDRSVLIGNETGLPGYFDRVCVALENSLTDGENA